MLEALENTELVWIDQPQQLRNIISELSAQDIIAVDTESNSLYAYQEQVCLLQISTRKKDYLVDALVLPDLSPLAPIFRSESILKVFHAAEYDLICLSRDYGFQFNFLFDTMIAARTLGYQKIGLGALLEQFFDIQMNKKYQRANWGKRPIKQDMLEYARLDSHFLIPLQEQLRLELLSSGRWELALEDFERLKQNIEDTTETGEDDFWKLRGARDLSPQKAAILKALYQFRDSKAKAQNRPPFKIISHQALVEMAKSPPKNRGELSKLPAMNQQWANQYGKDLLQAIQEGTQASPEYPPHFPRPEDGILNRIEALSEWRKITGKNLGVPSDVILPRDVLNRIGRAGPQSKEDLKDLMRDVPYRFIRFGDEIFIIINKGDNQP